MFALPRCLAEGINPIVFVAESAAVYSASHRLKNALLTSACYIRHVDPVIESVRSVISKLQVSTEIQSRVRVALNSNPIVFLNDPDRSLRDIEQVVAVSAQVRRLLSSRLS